MWSFLKQATLGATLLLTAGPLAAQTSTLPQLAAEKLCACVGVTPQSDSAAARLQRCLPKALVEAAAQQGSLQSTTVEGIQGALIKTRELAVVSCPPVRNAFVSQRTQHFYAPSATAAAQQAYEAGTTLLEKQQFREALPFFLQAIKHDRQFVKAYDHAAICYRQTKNLKKAAAYYEKSLDLFPEGDVALLNMAVVQSLLEKPAEARTYFDKLRFFHPYNPEGYFGVGKMALLASDFPSALDNLFQAHRLYEEQKSPYLTDSNKMISLMYGVMKEKEQLELFRSKAKEHHFTIQE